MRYQIEFTTRAFEAAHNKRPSGRGSWAFCPAQYADRDDYQTFVFWYSGMYSDAKRAAAEHFSQHRGCSLIVVMS
jgi:hypothetical protein